MASTEERTLGQVLRRRRRQLGLTQEEVAKRTKTSTPYIGHLESAKRHPSDKMIASLAAVLGLDSRELFLLANPRAQGDDRSRARIQSRFGVGYLPQRRAAAPNSQHLGRRDGNPVARGPAGGSARNERLHLYTARNPSRDRPLGSSSTAFSEKFLGSR